MFALTVIPASRAARIPRSWAEGEPLALMFFRKLSGSKVCMLTVNRCKPASARPAACRASSCPFVVIDRSMGKGLVTTWTRRTTSMTVSAPFR